MAQARVGGQKCRCHRSKVSATQNFSPQKTAEKKKKFKKRDATSESKKGTLSLFFWVDMALTVYQ